MKKGYGEAHASFGELIQGNRYVDSTSYLVTLPINLMSRVTFIPEETNGIRVVPEYKVKIIAAIKHLEKEIGHSISGTFYVDSLIPEGKGLSSSSADLVGSIRAYCDSCNINISAEMIGEIVSFIEPSDAVMYDNIVMYYNLNGVCVKQFDFIPRLSIIAIDQGGVVETSDCYKARAKQTKEIHYLQELLLKRLDYAMEKKDTEMICQISTQSAIINQNVLPKKYLNFALKLVDKFGISGIIVAHTGTYLGLLFNKEDINYIFKLEKVKSELIKKILISKFLNQSGESELHENRT